MSATCACGTNETRCVCSGADEACPALPPEVCESFQPGMNGRCAWCDHGPACHILDIFIGHYRVGRLLTVLPLVLPCSTVA